MGNKLSLNFIDVFSGAGGLSCGMELAGLECVLGIEMDKHAAQTFSLNHKHAKTYCGDIRQLSGKMLQEYIGEKKVDAVIGGPPCQGFSTVGKGDPNDIRNTLFREFVRIVQLTNPTFVVIENVTGILAEKNELTMQAIFKEFYRMGYQLKIQVMSAENYGVPEKRRRTIIIGSKLKQEITFPEPLRKVVTVGDAFNDLKAADGKCYNHDEELAQVKSQADLERLKHIPEGQGIRYQEDEERFLPKELKLNIDWKKIPEGRFRQTKFQRLDRKKPSPTIMTHRHSYYHPFKHRYLTQREAARLQSFPNDFIFCGPLSAQWRQIGNAVPPMLGKAIGSALLSMWKKADKSAIHSKIKFNSNDFSIADIREKAFVYK